MQQAIPELPLSNTSHLRVDHPCLNCELGILLMKRETIDWLESGVLQWLALAESLMSLMSLQ